jgi:hypothetical protein
MTPQKILIGSKRVPAREMIGRVSSPYTANFVYSPQTVDLSRTDYAFWDQLRYGKKSDYSIGGLFAKPIGRILSTWTLGKGVDVDVAESPATEAALNKFLADYLVDILKTTEDHFSLGDAYIIVNPDLSLIRVSPDQIQAITEPVGSNNVVGYCITTKLPTQMIKDCWYADRRERTVTQNGVPTTTTYPNLIGMLPVIPWHCDTGVNELYGRPYYEALLNLFARYNRTLNKALDGVDIMGNPIPTVEGADDPEETLRLLSGGRTRTYIDEDGNSQSQYVVDLSSLPVVVLGSGASLKFAAPTNGFTGDSGKMLEYLFLLMLQHTGIPEWAWGGAIASSKASVDAQMPAFVALIDALRLMLKRPLLQLFKVWLTYRALSMPAINAQADISLSFAALIAEDRGQKLEEVKFAREDNSITRTAGLRVLGLVDDPEHEVQLAQAEAAQDKIDPVDTQLANALETLKQDRYEPLAETAPIVDLPTVIESKVETDPVENDETPVSDTTAKSAESSNSAVELIVEAAPQDFQIPLFDFEIYAY